MTAHPPLEVELKLTADPAVLDRLDSHAALAPLSEPRSFVSTYYDTPDLALRAQGLALRIRRDGERRVQTLKATNGAAAGLFRRGEWEAPAGADVPAPSGMEGSPLERLLPDEAAWAGLQPVFSVAVERRTSLVERNGALVEIALDQGRVEADGRARDVAELELELIRGAPADVFDLARELAECGPLRLSTASKSQLGYALLDPPRASVKAGDMDLERKSSTARAFQAIGRACLLHYAQNEPLLRERRSPGALHQARIGLRRLRAAVSLFSPLLRDPQSLAMRADLKRLAGCWARRATSTCCCRPRGRPLGPRRPSTRSPADARTPTGASSSTWTPRRSRVCPSRWRRGWRPATG